MPCSIQLCLSPSQSPAPCWAKRSGRSRNVKKCRLSRWLISSMITYPLTENLELLCSPTRPAHRQSSYQLSHQPQANLVKSFCQRQHLKTSTTIQQKSEFSSINSRITLCHRTYHDDHGSGGGWLDELDFLFFPCSCTLCLILLSFLWQNCEQ